MTTPLLVTILCAITAAFMAHKLTELRSKNDLVIKRKESQIIESKTTVEEFERAISVRIALTRQYLFELQDHNSKIHNDPENDLRKKYRESVQLWNANYIFITSKIYRIELTNAMHTFEALQIEFRKIHGLISLIVKSRVRGDYINDDSIKKAITDLSKIQTEVYSFTRDLHKSIDNHWDDVLNAKKSKSGQLATILKRWIKDTSYLLFILAIIYVAINTLLFVLSPLLP